MKPAERPHVSAMKTEQRAAWLFDRVAERPGLISSYAVKMKELRQHFGCGKVAAEQAHKRYLEMCRESIDPTKKPELEAMVRQKFADIAERAERTGKVEGMRVASATWDRYRRMAGLGAADRVEHTDGDDGLSAKLRDASDEQLTELLKNIGIEPTSSGE